MAFSIQSIWVPGHACFETGHISQMLAPTIRAATLARSRGASPLSDSGTSRPGEGALRELYPLARMSPLTALRMAVEFEFGTGPVSIQIPSAMGASSP